MRRAPDVGTRQAVRTFDSPAAGRQCLTSGRVSGVEGSESRPGRGDCADCRRKLQLRASREYPAEMIGQSVDLAVEEPYTVAMLGCCGKLRPSHTAIAWVSNS